MQVTLSDVNRFVWEDFSVTVPIIPAVTTFLAARYLWNALKTWYDGVDDTYSVSDAMTDWTDDEDEEVVVPEYDDSDSDHATPTSDHGKGLQTLVSDHENPRQTP